MTTSQNQELARTGDDSERYAARAADVAARYSPAATVAWAGLWLALVTGFVEVAILAYRRYALGAFIARSRDFWWMAPLGDLILIGVPALLLALIARRWPRLVTLRVATWLIALPCALSVLLLLFYQRLHNVALLVLAVGAAVQAARWAGAHAAGFGRAVRRTTPLLLGLVLLLAGALPGARAWRERRALAALPAPPAGAPNVLLIILDTVRAASLSLYGYAQPTTPKLARWAARGVVFEQAMAPA
ncbi:MAG TPA: sulfatase-like hydrolase/transferase, partial [Gemmatimonadaceae bacterium]|nr:sulfatase-like hydrolase/transferase [Gemmatimonadaceae bacterium]